MHPGATSHVTADGSRVQDDAGKCLFEAEKEKILTERAGKHRGSGESSKSSGAEASQEDDEDASWLPSSWKADVLQGRKKKVGAQADITGTSAVPEAAHDAAKVDDPPNDGRKTLKREEDGESQGNGIQQMSDGGAEAFGTTNSGTDVENPKDGDLGITD